MWASRALSVAWLAAVGTFLSFTIPVDNLYPFADYGQRSATVLSAIYERIAAQPAAVFTLWLIPAAVCPFVPLSWLQCLYELVGFILAIFVWILLVLVWNEWPRFLSFLRDDPAAAYMAHDVFLLLVVCALYDMRNAWLIVGGPWLAVSQLNDDASSNVPAYVYLLAAFISIIVVLPTQHRYIDENGELFLAGYTTSSLIGKVYSWGMITVWVMTFHRVGHLTRITFRARPVTSVTFLLIGTALVELYVGAALAVVAAYAKLMQSNRGYGSEEGRPDRSMRV